ncbi:MAG: GNAT family N-acetyltransferase [Acidimicrobiales bacterium]
MEVTGITPGELDDFIASVEAAFSAGKPSKQDIEQEREVTDPARMLVAREKGRVIGTTGSHSLRMRVPGGAADVAGVTAVGVDPTRRRRGVLTALMRRQLESLHETSGEAVAVLWAAEQPIYGRFGYGCAARSVSLSLPRRTSLLSATDHGPARSEYDLEVGEPAEVVSDLASVEAGAAPARPGTLLRDARWWRHSIYDPEERRQGASRLVSVVARAGEMAEGFAMYATKTAWEGGLASGSVLVRDVQATTAGAYEALWRFLLGLDLYETVMAWNRPLDDPLFHLVSDWRAAKPTVVDNVWARVLDVPKALEQRSYGIDFDLVLQVDDPLCPWVAGRFALSGGPQGATCHSVERAPDVVIGVAGLSSMLFGGQSAVALGAAGRAREVTPGALAVATRAFRGNVEPHCQKIF